MSNTRIHFIGTVHNDPKGPERLEKALRYESPCVITVEASKDRLDYLEAEGIPLIHQKIDSLGFSQADTEFLKKRFGRVEFEVGVSRLYALQHNLPLHYIDLRDVEEDKKHVSIICDLSRDKWEAELFHHFLQGTGRRDSISIDDDNKRYTRYQDLFDDESFREQKYLDFYARNLQSDRDSFMAGNIERIIKPETKIVHIGGIAHCLRDVQGRTLFSKLRKYDPTRATLKWYDDK